MESLYFGGKAGFIKRNFLGSTRPLRKMGKFEGGFRKLGKSTKMISSSGSMGMMG